MKIPIVTGKSKKKSPPRYMQIYEWIKNRIREGKLRVGDPVGPERQLARDFGVSLMTVRQAIQMIELEGLVERRHGSGTYVRVPRINWNRLSSLTEQMRAQGLTVSSRVLDSGVVRANEEIAAKLLVRPRAPLVRLKRLRMCQGQPLGVEDCLLPFDLFPQLLDHQLGHESLFEILEREYGVCITHAEETIEACAAERSAAELLGVRVHDPLLRLTQLLFGSLRQPIGFAIGLYHADRHQFRVIRTRSSGIEPAPKRAE